MVAYMVLRLWQIEETARGGLAHHVSELGTSPHTEKILIETIQAKLKFVSTCTINSTFLYSLISFEEKF
jgi:hypothetical protein